MAHYVNTTNEKPGRFYGQYLLGDTMELTDGSIWEYHPEVGWFPTQIGAVTSTTNPLTGGSALSADGAVFALSEVSAYVPRTTTGTAFTGACEYAGYICTVAAGNITVYDNTSASGTVIVPTTALALGAFPIFGAGTNGKMALTTGCHVVLSGAATVNVLVQ